MRSRRFLFWTAASILAALLGATAADAEPGPITLASSNGLEQANTAAEPALSANGRYLAFAGGIGGLSGVFRKDLTTGEIVPVVTESESEAVAEGGGASAPSISSDGRYVSFTTTEPLDPIDDPAPRTSDVYVADMSTSPPSYTLVSARDGSDQGLTYEMEEGSVASSRAAISADGNEVVFVTTGASDLTGAQGATEAPALQVAVRNIAARRTTLISVVRDPETGAMEPTSPVEGGAAYTRPSLLPGAAISADGTTVAWIGTHVALQAAVAPAEAAGIAGLEANERQYTEPLWRRVPTAADPAPETRRMVSAAQFPQVSSGQNLKPLSAGGECSTSAGWILAKDLTLETTPSLSADGDEVAVVGEPESYSDAFVFDMTGQPMAEQLTRAIQAPQNIACESGSSPTLKPGSGIITGVAISPAGDRVALTTTRQRFPLAPPTLIGSPPLRVGLPELYLVDLTAGTLQRLTHGVTSESEPSLIVPEVEGAEFGARSVSFDANGETLAFGSQASNLVPGDGNGGLGGSDAFLVTDPRGVATPGASAITSRPPPLRPTPRRILKARATSRADGSVRVAVSVPGAGHLRATAKTLGGKHAKARRIATARRRPLLASTIAFDLKPARRFKTKVHAKGGVEGQLRLEFSGPGGGPLHAILHVRFHAHAKKKKGSGK